MLVLDAAEAGLWRVSADDADDVAVLTPLSSRTFWRLLLTLIARASEAATQARRPLPPGVTACCKRLRAA